MLVNIGGKLLAAEQRDGGRIICAVFADNHIITIAFWSHACEDIIGRLGGCFFIGDLSDCLKVQDCSN